MIDKSKKIAYNSSEKKSKDRVFDRELNNKIVSKSLTTFNYDETDFEDSIRIELDTEQHNNTFHFSQTSQSISSINSSLTSNMAYTNNFSNEISNDPYSFENSNNSGYTQVNHYANQTYPEINQNKTTSQLAPTQQQQAQRYQYENKIPPIQQKQAGQQNGLNKGLFNTVTQTTMTNQQMQKTAQASSYIENEMININNNNNNNKSNASKVSEINNEVEFILNNRTLLFEGQHIHTYKHNYNALNNEINKYYPSIQLDELSIVDVGYDMNGKQVPKRLWDEIKISHTISYLKIVFFDGRLDDYIRLRDAKNNHTQMFGGIRRINNNMTLSIHLSVPSRIDLSNEDIIKSLQEYGVKDVKRGNNTNGNICRLDMVDVKSWANLCKCGIRIRNKHYVCKYWEQNLKRCRKCLMIGHIEGDVKCEERCKKCGEKTHKGACSSSTFNCVNCRKNGSHTYENNKDCIVFKAKKTELNQKYEKIMKLLNIQIESYNHKPNYDEPATKSNNMDSNTFDQMLATSAYLNKKLGDIGDTVIQVQNEVKGIKKVEEDLKSIHKYLDRIDNKLDKYFGGERDKPNSMESETSTNGSVVSNTNIHNPIS